MAGQLQTQMRERDKEMVPRVLVVAMFSLMVASVALVAFAQWTDRPNVGVVSESAVSQSVEITLTATKAGHYHALAPDGELLADSAIGKNGFIGVIGKAVDRERMLHHVAGSPPLQVVRREDGLIAILDPATDMNIPLLGYGVDNVAAFARLLPSTQGN